MLSLGEKIVLYRKRRKLSQAELAEIAGVSRNSISMLERGEYNPTLDQLRKISTALEVELVVDLSSLEQVTE
jgi:transcriptional regulator with XRE-family HTH domain